MPVQKRTYESGKTVWYYIFDAPGSTRQSRQQIKESGFATKREAEDAEAQRRLDEKQKYELAKARHVDAPLPKTGVVSSAFAHAIKWGLVAVNLVEQSDPPTPRKRKGTALTPAQQRLVIEAASGCWCLPTFLEVSAATGARRGEVLALRWADYVDGVVFVARSLSQTRKGLEFKGTKLMSRARLFCLAQPSRL